MTIDLGSKLENFWAYSTISSVLGLCMLICIWKSTTPEAVCTTFYLDTYHHLWKLAFLSGTSSSRTTELYSYKMSEKLLIAHSSLWVGLLRVSCMVGMSLPTTLQTTSPVVLEQPQKRFRNNQFDNRLSWHHCDLEADRMIMCIPKVNAPLVLLWKAFPLVSGFALSGAPLICHSDDLQQQENRGLIYI